MTIKHWAAPKEVLAEAGQVRGVRSQLRALRGKGGAEVETALTSLDEQVASLESGSSTPPPTGTQPLANLAHAWLLLLIHAHARAHGEGSVAVVPFCVTQGTLEHRTVASCPVC